MFLFFTCNRLTLFLLLIFFFKAIGRPSLSKFHHDHVHRARLHDNRNFHSLVNLLRLATWGLSPNPSVEALGHELAVHRRKSFLCILRIFFLSVI